MHKEEIIRLYELQMLATASNFSLWETEGRRKSADALAEFFYGITRAIKPSTFIEAGARQAYASTRIRSLCPETEIFAFEANPYNYEYFSRVGSFEADRVNYIHKAISETSGTITFNIRKTVDGKEVTPLTGQSSLLKRADDKTTYEEVTVPAASLDELFPSAPTNTIWIDVEGATRGVIEGGRSVLAKSQAAIVEMSDRSHWDGEWLATRVISELYDLGLVPVARDFEFRSQYNVVFLNRDTLMNHEIRRNVEYFHSVLCKR
ncbi:FkbM family methyltransferase [Sinorhizobium prairiense]|uniref:FkbM family methyltransferase n=1 Tax=unclassified Sinorhizobium TaxID=2613772 RepID=UPI0023D88094|nr:MULTISPECIES: FkbM family methyltransferase [unclassified Sinorhizobium]WEJ12938.1 FkbM family methyltransferase [Sinorhizobium sp. M103]WEJ18023.1 FkbM family methyltransferase [Sinorhizobium sp. K101]WEJ40028.1 FkbM family methyltransferase [Sinorhizobium sp. C101]